MHISKVTLFNFVIFIYELNTHNYFLSDCAGGEHRGAAVAPTGRDGEEEPAGPAKHSRPYWGYVELVTTKVQDIKDALKEGTVCGVLSSLHALN